MSVVGKRMVHHCCTESIGSQYRTPSCRFAYLEVLLGVDVEPGHLSRGGDVTDRLDGRHDEGKDAGEDEGRVHRQRVREHPQERDAVGWKRREVGVQHIDGREKGAGRA